MRQTSLLSAPYRAARAPGDRVSSFQQIIADKRGRLLDVPPHQRRPDVWRFDKKKTYVGRLQKTKNGGHPPGSFATYQIVRDGEPEGIEWLNDGYQRLTTLMELEADPALYDMDEAGVRALLQGDISIQHRHYPSHEAAMKDFQYINNGTRLTNDELCQGFLTYTPGYEAYWGPLLSEVCETVRDSETRLRTSRTARRTTETRDFESKLSRHVWALFYRFLMEEKRPCQYKDVTAKDVQRYIDKGEVIEQRLRLALLERGRDQVERQVRLFRQFVDAETQLLIRYIGDVLASESAGLSAVTHRWLLDLAVWRRTNRIPVEMHRTFVEKLLKGTRGRTQWTTDGDGTDSVILQLGHLGQLPRLARLVGMPEFTQPRRRSSRGNLLPLPGCDISHEQPFATHGDGPTFPEPAPINRARGARPVEAATDDGQEAP